MANRSRETMSHLKRQFSYGSSSQSSEIACINNELDPSIVKTYVQNNPELLDKIILHLRSSNDLEMLLQQKESKNVTDHKLEPETKDDVNTTCNILSIKDQTEEYLKSTQEQDLGKIFYNAAMILARTLKVDWFSLYLPRHNKKILYEYEFGGSEKQYGPIGTGMTVSAASASLCRTLIVENLPQNGKYPNGVGHPERNIHNVLSVPLVFPSGDLLGVIELCNTGMKDPFNIKDLQTSNSLLGWMVSSLYEAKLNSVFVIQSKLNDFLMNKSKELFDGKICINDLAKNILLFSRDLVHADRCSMFLINEEKNKLYADYFDERLDKDEETGNSITPEVEFSVDKGIAGYVYKTGELVNVYDAYADARFNPDIDQLTGYATRNILCVPLIGNSCVVGVVQMINSLSDDHFTHADEYALKTYAVYCAMALHYSNLYNLLRHSETKYKITLEVLQFHIVAPDIEGNSISDVTPPEMIPARFSGYEFNAYSYEERLPQLYIYMIQDLFGKQLFDFNKMRRFVLTIRKNYRPMPYHNWTHGFHVAHKLYCMIKQNANVFTNKEKMALMIAGLCHDVDHRGYNNVFYKKFDLPLALYCNVMEQHHFNQTCTILELVGHDIFSFLSSYDYELMLHMIHDLIIATDLSLYFNNQNNVLQMQRNKTFDLGKEECKTVCKALMMEAADISSASMPWTIHRELVSRIYSEFYNQGDIEKEKGLHPMVLMDREYEEAVPDQQVGFINFTCKPLFSILLNIFPTCKPLMDGIELNLTRWQRLVAKKDKLRRRKHLALQE